MGEQRSMTVEQVANLKTGDRFETDTRAWQLATVDGHYWAEGRVRVSARPLYSDGTVSTILRRVWINLGD